MLLNAANSAARGCCPTTVALMASGHLPPDITYGRKCARCSARRAPVPENGIGFGLGFAVAHACGRNALPGLGRRLFLERREGTYFWIDPRQQLIAILMMQAARSSDALPLSMRAMSIRRSWSESPLEVIRTPRSGDPESRNQGKKLIWLDSGFRLRRAPE